MFLKRLAEFQRGEKMWEEPACRLKREVDGVVALARYALLTDVVGVARDCHVVTVTGNAAGDADIEYSAGKFLELFAVNHGELRGH